MKNIILFVFLSVFCCCFMNAQVSVDPENEFYADAVSWKLKGFIDRLPQLKPYPVNVIKNILNTVAESGDAQESEKAEYYYKSFFNKPWNVSAGVNASAKVRQAGSSDKKHLDAEIRVSGDIAPSDLFSVGYSFGFSGENDDVAAAEILPKFVFDSKKQKIDSFSVDAGDLDFNFDLNAITSFGKENVYVTLGLNKTGFGPFSCNDIALNPAAYQSLNLTLNCSGKYIDYTQMLAMIGAEKHFGQSSYYANKYLAFHSIRFPLFSRKLYVSYYESAVWGKDFIPYYVMPAPYLVMTNEGGSYENLQTGILLELKLMPCLEWATNVFVDDIKIKEILKLKTDTGSRVAAQTGFIYTPLNSVCSMITADYTVVMPYTYSYYDTRDSSYNYADYTNCGMSMGSNLPPNSDRVSFMINFKPVNGLKIRTLTTFGRHANAYESISADEVAKLSGKNVASDGSIKMNDQDLDTATDMTNFLKQGNIMYFIQAGLSAEYEIPRTKAGAVSITGGYVFEYIRNDGVDNPIYSGLSIDAAADADAVAAAVSAAHKAWADNLHDTYNNYFYIGLKYVY